MIIALTLLACLADIRPEGLTDDAKKGQALLEAAAQASGATAYAEVQGSTATMHDVWPAPYGLLPMAGDGAELCHQERAPQL